MTLGLFPGELALFLLLEVPLLHKWVIHVDVDFPGIVLPLLFLTVLLILHATLLFFDFSLALALEPVLFDLCLHAGEVLCVAFLPLEVGLVLLGMLLPVRFLGLLFLGSIGVELLNLVNLELVLFDVLEGLSDLHEAHRVAVRRIWMVDFGESDEGFFALLDAIAVFAVEDGECFVVLGHCDVLLVAAVADRELTIAVSEQ